MNLYFDLHHTVSDDEIDSQGHVHNLRYLQWTLWAARDHSAAAGWDVAAGLDRGVGWVVRSHDIVFRAAAFAGDELTIRTWISQVDRFASRRRYLVTRPADQSILARVETRWAFVDLNRRKAVDIPDALMERIAIVSRSPGPPWENRV